MKCKLYKNGFWNEKVAKKYFKYFHPFYNVFIEKPKIKHLSNTELLQLPFYDEFNVVEISKTFT